MQVRALLPAFLLLVPCVAIVVGLWWGGRAWLALALYHAWMIAIVARDGSLRNLARGFRFSWAIPLALAGLATGPLLVLLFPYARATARPVEEILRSVDLGGAAWWPFALYYAFVHPGIEEAYWRGSVAPRLRHEALSDLGYGGYHALVLVRFVAWPAAVATALGLAIVGGGWRWIARRTGGLALPWLCHLAADASFIAALIWLVRTGM